MPKTFETDVHIQADPDRVFAAMTDLDHYSEWMPNFVAVEKLTDGDYGVGTEFRETRKMFGKSASEHFEVVGFEPPQKVVLHVDGTKGATGKGSYRFDHVLTEEDGGTRLRMIGEIDMPGVVASLLSGLMIGTFRKACAKDLAALKSHIENQS